MNFGVFEFFDWLDLTSPVGIWSNSYALISVFWNIKCWSCDSSLILKKEAWYSQMCIQCNKEFAFRVFRAIHIMHSRKPLWWEACGSLNTALHDTGPFVWLYPVKTYKCRLLATSVICTCPAAHKNTICNLTACHHRNDGINVLYSQWTLPE